MTTALVLVPLVAATAAVVRQLNANHRRIAAWPASEDSLDRDAARVRSDLAAARPALAVVAARPRVVSGHPTARRLAPPAARAA